MNPLVYLYLLLAGAAASLLLVPLFKALSVRLGMMDEPRPGRIHARPTALLGGPAIFAGMLLVVGGHYLAAQFLADSGFAARWLAPETLLNLRHSSGGDLRLLAILAGAVVILAVGLADDARSLPIPARLGAETAAATLVVLLGIHPKVFFLPDWLTGVLAVVWIVGITNSFNLIDSMDGLAAGVAAIAAGLLGLWAGLSGQPTVAAFLASFAGLLAGFLAYNWAPASVFLGSSGSMLLGYFLSVAVLLSSFLLGSDATNYLPLVMPLLILGVPLYDTCSVVFIRLRRGRSPFAPDLNHLAHRLHRLGLSRRRTVLVIWLMTFTVGLGALLLATSPAVPAAFNEVVILVQALAVFGVIVVLELAGRGGRPVQLGTPVAAEVRLPAEGGGAEAALAGRVTRLGPGSARLEVAELSPEAAARWLGARAAGRLRLSLAPPFEPLELAATVRGVERAEAGGWRLSLEFGPLSGEARERMEFILSHYRGLGEG